MKPKKVNEIITEIKETKAIKWINEATTDKQIRKTFPNRLFLTKLLGVLAILCFIASLIISILAPRETIPYRTDQLFQTIAPYPTIMLYLFLSAIILGLPSIIFLLIHEYYEKYKEPIEKDPAVKMINHRLYIRGSILNKIMEDADLVYQQYDTVYKHGAFEIKVAECTDDIYFIVLDFTFMPFKITIGLKHEEEHEAHLKEAGKVFKDLNLPKDMELIKGKIFPIKKDE